jgi:hypothetical protein
MVQVGDKAPSLGADFSWLWATRPAIIVWLRHFGSRFFPEALTEIRDALPKFEEFGVNIMCVVQGDRTQAKEFCGALGADGLCIADPLRRSYQMMGFERAPLSTMIFSPPEQRERAREARRKGFKKQWGKTLQNNSDALQLPGAALVDTSGVVRWIYRGGHSGDTPTVSTLLGIAQHYAKR